MDFYNGSFKNNFFKKIIKIVAGRIVNDMIGNLISTITNEFIKSDENLNYHITSIFRRILINTTTAKCPRNDYNQYITLKWISQTLILFNAKDI